MGKKLKKAPPSSLQKLKKLFDVVEKGKLMWEATFDAIRDPVLIINKNFRILRANKAAAERSRHSISKLIGQTCYQTFAGRKEICPGCPLQMTLQNRSARMVEIPQMMKDGDFTVNSYPMGEDSTVVHHYRDVTEERRLQRKLIQSEKMAAIGMLAGGVAHEINNPLAGILAFAQLLKNELQGSEEAQSDLTEIEQAAKRCKKIVEDLLMFSRPHGESEQGELLLSDVIEPILPLAKLDLRHRRLSLTTQYEESLPKVRGNSMRLQQVFLNLIHNAAQAMEEGGEVRVRVKTSEDRRQVWGEVEDDGAGIGNEDIGRIFDPFYSTKARAEGTGLGLSICYSIVREHGGKIEVESEVGRGSLFRVILPTSEERR